MAEIKRQGCLRLPPDLELRAKKSDGNQIVGEIDIPPEVQQSLCENFAHKKISGKHHAYQIRCLRSIFSLSLFLIKSD